MDKDNLLIEASKIGLTKIVRVLLQAGADVNVADDYVLICVSKNGHIEVVHELLQAGTNVHAQDDLASY